MAPLSFFTPFTYMQKVFDLDIRMMILGAIGSAPVVDRLLWTPLVTCKAHFASVLPNRFAVNEHDVLNRT
jgi:hypothetical protein